VEQSAPTAQRRSVRERLGDALALADLPDDSDDLRLRKRMAVAAGYATALAVLTMPLFARGHIVAIAVAGSTFALCVLNLAVLARSRRFERYVVALAIAGGVFVVVATWLGGGPTLMYSGLVWAVLVPAIALLALGPQSAGRWYAVFLAVVAGAVALDLIWHEPTGVDPYPIQLIGSVFHVVASFGIIFAMLVYSDRRRREAEARSDELLTNAIPLPIARRLKHGERRIADIYPETTVLFTDLVAFTPWAQRNAPTQVAGVLDRLFSRFDELVTAARLEKIKTIGDSYMAVSGAPEPRADHAQAAMIVALEMLEAVEQWRSTEGVDLAVRIGLASGPVAGGVIGDRRILFDLWGDTVNTAARMESSGEPGLIQIAESTKRLLGDQWRYSRREIEIKGIGPTVSYFVEERPTGAPLGAATPR
jgi:adenylate cyclase